MPTPLRLSIPAQRTAYRRLSVLAAVGLFLLLGPWRVAWAQCLPFTSQSGNVIDQVFPPTGPAETAWRVAFGHHEDHGAFVTGAWFKQDPGAPWTRVLWDARISEIFVPYDKDGPRFYESTYGSLIPVVEADLGPCGQPADDYIVKELRERGPIWKNYASVRRGHELWLWGGWGAGNYNYIIRYEFRDDGSIGFRVGATARNLPSLPWRAHSHTALWRLDIDLAGAGNDTIRLHRHHETTGATWADLTLEPFHGDHEGWEDWSALQSVVLNISDTVVTNGAGRNISYDLINFRSGTPRHTEDFVHHDFAVTNYRSGQLYYPDLPTYIDQAKKINNRDIVLWHASPGIHIPRTEDGLTTAGAVNGVALLMWSGFDLRPRDLFDATPLYP